MTNREPRHQLDEKAPAKEPLGKSLKKIFLWTTGVFVVLVVIGSIVGANKAPIPVRAATPAAAPVVSNSVTNPNPARASANPALPPGAEQVTVTRVVDGDTFEVGARRIRVLGIDSCEADTAGGRDATAAAQSSVGSPERIVTLTREPGVDKDRYGRELRYVALAYRSTPSLAPQDFGKYMVGAYHTGVYQGRNDASDTVVAELREEDQYSGRDCSSRPGPTGDVDVDVDNDGDRNMPDGALTGGYCARKWWC
ncbi:hypothetical protein PHK61_26700 [Actinomycetospora lutea]|uniref:thermonuclease family protein n=1 Tax=Actinomycetospora lutea TaxID=663604 RepID=UPI002365291D|nr:hypothetical protein [Actinomycetospora lutea]MDD7942011.1 hypothetical protein [Actinomycetospora lutea]